MPWGKSHPTTGPYPLQSSLGSDIKIPRGILYSIGCIPQGGGWAGRKSWSSVRHSPRNPVHSNDCISLGEGFSGKSCFKVRHSPGDPTLKRLYFPGGGIQRLYSTGKVFLSSTDSWGKAHITCMHLHVVWLDNTGDSSFSKTL